MLLCKFHGVHSGCMGAGSILHGDYDLIGVTLAADEDAGDDSVFVGGVSMITEDGDSAGGAGFRQRLLERDAMKLILFSRSDA